jgi:hypothetical protein
VPTIFSRDALLVRERHRGREIRDDVDRAGAHRLLRGGAAAKHDQLGLDAVLLEQTEPLRHKRRRIVEALGRKADADRVGLGGGGDRCGERRNGERFQAPHDVLSPVMAGLVPAIHAFAKHERRGCAGQARA